MSCSADGSIVLSSGMGQHTSQGERKSMYIHEIQPHGKNMEGKQQGRQQETSFGGLKLKCIYTLNNTLITAISQLLSFEYRDNRILQAT